MTFHTVILTGLRRRVWVFAVFLSRALNVTTGGAFKEPLCARIGRNAYSGTRHRKMWRLMQAGMDAVFFFDRGHCFRTFLHYSTKQET